MTVCFEERHYPCGTLYLAADAVALRAVAFNTNWPRIKAALGAARCK